MTEEFRSKESFEEGPASGAILVDGHHVFLEILRDVLRFNDLATKSPLAAKFRNDSRTQLTVRNIWSMLPPERIAGFIRTDLGWNLPSIVSRIAPIAAHPRDVDLWLFDARLSSQSEVTSHLEKQVRLITSSAKTAADVKLELVRSGRWSFFDGSGFLTIPFELKNDVIDRLTESAADSSPEVGDLADLYWNLGKEWRGRFGARRFHTRADGRFHEHEKGVDAHLIIQGCKLAADARVRWVCLVTNDSDYVPLVEHLHRHGKSVYWLSYASRKSGDLRSSVGAENTLEREHVQSSYNDRDQWKKIQEIQHRQSSSALGQLFKDERSVEYLFMQCVIDGALRASQQSYEELAKRIEALQRTDPEAYDELMKDVPF